MCEAEIKVALMGARRAQLQFKDAKLQRYKCICNARQLPLMAPHLEQIYS